MKIEPSRTRQRGTVVTLPKTPAERIAAVRQIVEEGAYAKIDGQAVDLFSASAIMAVYNALSEDKREHYASFPVGKMALVAFKLFK
ncbi:MAG: hypothetical protein ABSH28_01875 [Acidobacteriota bacterium]|jgi:hypothetical protein